ncbi:MAG: hypothetical protein K0Q59_757 [Paenibacillus sp.]|nr:hypothetical protein [Paenibacillus sp.]
MTSKPVVLVLGVFHFRYLNDILEPHRQKEILEVVQRIKEFRPTKICLEKVVEKNDELNAEYRDFVSGTLELTDNERHQLGFRIARELGHDNVYATDWMHLDQADMDVLERGFAEAENKQPELVKEAEAWTERLRHMLKPGTVLDMIRTHNDEEINAIDHQYYIRYRARLGEYPDYIGPFWLRWWYRRNLIIYSNIARLAAEDERLLVIYGSSHNYLLKQFIRESGLLEMESADAYLK